MTSWFVILLPVVFLVGWLLAKAIRGRRWGLLAGLGAVIALPVLLVFGAVLAPTLREAAYKVDEDAHVEWIADESGFLRSHADQLHERVRQGHFYASASSPEPSRFAVGFLSPVLVLLLGAVVVIAVVAAIKHRRSGALAVVGLLAASLLGAGVVHLYTDFGGMPELATIPVEPTQPSEVKLLSITVADKEMVRSQLATPEVASDLELFEAAVEQPKIPLDDRPPVAVRFAAAGDPSLPDWVKAKQPAGRVVLTSDPSATVSGARKKATAKLAAWVDAEVRDAHGDWAVGFVRMALAPGGFDSYYKRFGRAKHLSEVGTSVGRVHLMHVAAEMGEANQKWIAKTVAEASAAAQRSRRVRSVAFTGAGVLSLVAMAHLFLRMGPTVTPVVKEEAA